MKSISNARLRRGALALAIGMTVLLAGCKPADQADTAEKDAAAVAGEASTELVTPGLDNAKERASYMVGMDIGQSLKQIQDEVDIELVIEAMKTSMAGGEALLTEDQVVQVREAFATRLQTRRVAELQAQAEQNKLDGAKLLAANAEKPGVKTTESGLQYKVEVQGEGPQPKPSDVVKVHYKGMLPDGTVFDSSYERGEPAIMPLAQVIPGWREGVALMSVGSKYTMWIPGELAYGEAGAPMGKIEPNQTLVFEVELLDIVDTGAAQE